MANIILHGPDEAASTPEAAPAAAPARPVSPSQAIVDAANEMIFIPDSQGRQIGWRRLTALEDFDLTEIAGSAASNEQWMARANVAAGVREIDGKPVPRPGSKNALRAMVARLGTAGMAAIVNHFTEQAEEQDAAPSSEDRAKN